MGAKPAVVCKLQKNIILDAQNGFVDTFNWIVDWICNIKFENDTGLELDQKISDFPVVKSDKKKKSIICGTDSNIVFKKSEDNIIVDVYYV